MQISDQQRFELKVIFLRELNHGYEAAREALPRYLRSSDDDTEALESLHSFFHRIAGTAQGVGFEVLGYLCGVCERVTGLGLTRAIPPSAVAEAVSEGLEGVAHVLSSHGTSVSQRPPPREQTGRHSMLPEPTLGTHRGKIVVVDDDAVSAGLIDSCLKSAGFISTFTCDPHKAIDVIEEELPDLVIMDVEMPELDGFELCRRVRAHPTIGFIPIIFVTRNGDLEHRVQGLEVGGNDYVAKPFQPRELVARVRSQLQRTSTLREMAIRDGLTRCYNRRYFKTRLEQEVTRAIRYGHDMALAIIDADHFKRVNDDHGHVVGDMVLAHLSSVVTATVRSTDVVARYGGEEFAVLMVHAGLSEAHIICERIRERVGGEPFAVPNAETGDTSLRVPLTVSVGITGLVSTDTPESIVQRADAALYAAKNGGRNLVRVVDKPAER